VSRAQGLKGTNIVVLTRSPTGENHTLRSLHRPEGIEIGCPILTQTEGESDAQAEADEGADRSISRYFTRSTFQPVTVRLFETFWNDLRVSCGVVTESKSTQPLHL
jgi:hypothetical protein